jgi:hypothetical protein
MSYDADYESVYMVQFESGRTIYVGHWTVQDVIEYCADEHKGEVIKAIYKEVYTANENEEE